MHRRGSSWPGQALWYGLAASVSPVCEHPASTSHTQRMSCSHQTPMGEAGCPLCPPHLVITGLARGFPAQECEQIGTIRTYLASWPMQVSHVAQPCPTRPAWVSATDRDQQPHRGTPRYTSSPSHLGCKAASNSCPRWPQHPCGILLGPIC